MAALPNITRFGCWCHHAANTAIFGTLYQIILKPLPCPDSDHLMRISFRSQNAELTTHDPNVSDFHRLEEFSGPFLKVPVTRQRRMKL